MHTYFFLEIYADRDMRKLEDFFPFFTLAFVAVTTT